MTKKEWLLFGMVLLWLGLTACQGTAQSVPPGAASGPAAVANSAPLPVPLPASGPALAGVEPFLAEGLETVSVAVIHDDKALIEYYPTGVVLGTAPKKDAGQLLRVPAGPRIMIQGVISLMAAPADEQKLLERVKARYGDNAAIKKKLPDTFALVGEINGKTCVNRPRAGGSLEGIPVQAMVEDPGPNKPLVLNVRVDFFSGDAGTRYDVSGTTLTGSETRVITKGLARELIIRETREVSSQSAVAVLAVTGEGAFSFERIIELK